METNSETSKYNLPELTEAWGIGNAGKDISADMKKKIKDINSKSNYNHHYNVCNFFFSFHGTNAYRYLSGTVWFWPASAFACQIKPKIG